MNKSALVIGAVSACLISGSAYADSDYFRPVTNEVTLEECSACHMAFQPAFLPMRSWKAIMADLPNHFGEDASLDEASRQEIEDYLVTYAGDALGRNRDVTRLSAGKTPLRITELYWWLDEHDADEVSKRAWDRAGSKANCTACHRDAESGYYDDD